MLHCRNTFTPFAARTQQFVKEQLGQADQKTELPADYLELEKRVDALKQAHQKLLAVTSVLSAGVSTHEWYSILIQ